MSAPEDQARSGDEASAGADLRGSPYRWVHALARGGMGDVHVVEHVDLGERRVMKVLKLELLSDDAEHYTARLRAEARLLVSLRHPNLVEVRDFGFTASGRPYLVTELLEGETLRQTLIREGELPLDRALHIIRQTLAGLAVVHAKNLVHRDIKPDNLFLCRSEEEHLKILDFGVTKVLGAATRENVGLMAETKSGLIVGTPSHVSPEQVLALPVTARSDIYAVGCVLYQMLRGRAPFAGRSLSETLGAHVTELPAPLAASLGVPPWVEAVVMKALAKEPEARFASAGEMLEALASEGAGPPAAKKEGRQLRTIPMHAWDGPRPESAAPADELATVVAPSPFAGASVLRAPERRPADAAPTTQKLETVAPASPFPQGGAVGGLPGPSAILLPERPRTERPARPLSVRRRAEPRSPFERAIPLLLLFLAIALLLLLGLHFWGARLGHALPMLGAVSMPEISRYTVAGKAMTSSTHEHPRLGGSRGTFRMSPVSAIEPMPDRARFDIGDLRRQVREALALANAPAHDRPQVTSPLALDAPARAFESHPVFASSASQYASALIPRKGDELMQYRIVDALNEGGMALLYEAQHQLIGKPFALKVLRPEHTQNELTVARFIAEFRVSHELRGHPNLVDVHELGFDPRFGHFMIMELLRGENLRGEMNRRAAERGQLIPFEVALHWVIVVAETLHAAHQLGFIHRDIKPENIFIAKEAGDSLRVVVLDWGCAKSKHGPHTTHEQHAAATALYMSPEQAERKTITGQTDQYSLNHVLYELLCRHAFSRAISENPRSPALYQAWQCHSVIEPPPAHLSTPALTRVLVRAFSKRPSDRFESLEAYAMALREVLKSGDRPAAAPPPKAYRPTAPSRGLVSRVADLPMVQLPPAEPLDDRDEPRDSQPSIALSDDCAEPSLVVLWPETLFGQRYALGESGVIGRRPGVCNIVLEHESVSLEHLNYTFISGGVNHPIYGLKERSQTNRVQIGRVPSRERATTIIVGEKVQLGDVWFAIAPPGPIAIDRERAPAPIAVATERLPMTPEPAPTRRHPPPVEASDGSAHPPASEPRSHAGPFSSRRHGWRHAVLGPREHVQMMFAGFAIAMIVGMLLLDWFGRLGGHSLFHRAP